MIQFAFKTCPETQAFGELIVHEMMSTFGISQEEAVGRINRRWGHLELTNPQHIIFHDDETFWARDIYFGHDSVWWKDEANAKPLPYP